jgi:hypothetical protein
MTQEYDDSYVADLIDDYRERRRVAEKAPKHKMSRALKKRMPNPVVEWERRRGYR